MAISHKPFESRIYCFSKQTGPQRGSDSRDDKLVGTFNKNIQTSIGEILGYTCFASITLMNIVKDKVRFLLYIN